MCFLLRITPKGRLMSSVDDIYIDLPWFDTPTCQLKVGIQEYVNV